MRTWYRDSHDGPEYGDRELVFRFVNVVLAFDDDLLGGVRREATIIFVIVNSRTPKIEAIKIGKSRKKIAKKKLDKFQAEFNCVSRLTFIQSRRLTRASSRQPRARRRRNDPASVTTCRADVSANRFFNLATVKSRTRCVPAKGVARWLTTELWFKGAARCIGTGSLIVMYCAAGEPVRGVFLAPAGCSVFMRDNTVHWIKSSVSEAGPRGVARWFQ
jgi:hypothetical protein